MERSASQLSSVTLDPIYLLKFTSSSSSPSYPGGSRHGTRLSAVQHYIYVCVLSREAARVLWVLTHFNA
jgi:hypothetical protein